MSLGYVPKELYVETMYLLDPRSLLILCQINKYTAKICLDDNFWKNYVIFNKEKYYEFHRGLVETGSITWKDVALTRGKYIYFFNEDTNSGSVIEITPEMSIADIENIVRDKINNREYLGFYSRKNFLLRDTADGLPAYIFILNEPLDSDKYPVSIINGKQWLIFYSKDKSLLLNPDQRWTLPLNSIYLYGADEDFTLFDYITSLVGKTIGRKTDAYGFDIVGEINEKSIS